MMGVVYDRFHRDSLKHYSPRVIDTSHLPQGLLVSVHLYSRSCEQSISEIPHLAMEHLDDDDDNEDEDDHNDRYSVNYTA